MRALAACALLYLVLAAAFLHHEVVDTPGGIEAPAAADLLAFYQPQMRYAFAELRAGRLPLWNPHQAAGIPLLAHPALGFFYPLYAPFLLLDVDTALAAHIVVHLALAALGMFLFSRAAGLASAAAVVAGIVYAFQGSMRIKLFHPTFLIGAAAIPWLFWLVLRLLQRPSVRRAASLGLCLGVVILGGELQFLYFAGLALLPLIGTLLIADIVHPTEVVAALVAAPPPSGHKARDYDPAPRGRAGRSIAMLALATLLGVGIGSVRLWPAAELMRQSWRPPGGLSLADAAISPLPPHTLLSGLLTPVPPPADTPWLTVHGLQESYLGIPVLICAGLGLLFWPRRAVALPLAAAGIAAAWYAGGADSAFYRLLFWLPGGAWFRGPDRVLIVCGFAIALLCGAGIDVAWRAPASGRSPLVAGAALAATLAVLGLGLAFGNPAGTPMLLAYLITALLLLVACAVPATPQWLRAAASVALAALIFVDLAHARALGARLPGQLHAERAANAALFGEISRRQDHARTYIDSGLQSGALRFSDTAKAGTDYGLWLATDYDGQSGQRLATYLDRLGSRPFNPMGFTSFSLTPQNRALADLMGIRLYAVEQRPSAEVERRFAPLADTWQRVWSDGAVGLYQHDGALPRAFVVDRVDVVPDPAQLLDRLAGADLRAIAFVEEPGADLPTAAAEHADAAAARIVAYEPNRVVIDAQSGHGGFLVLTDQYDRWWQARVDGDPARIYRTDFLFRGVAVPAGAHRVEFRYRPWNIALGGAGSALTLFVTLVLLAVRR